MARQVLTGLKGKLLKTLSTDLLLQEVVLEQWTLVDADTVDERDVKTLPTLEKVYDNDGNLIKRTEYEIITEREQEGVGREVLYRLPKGQTIWDTEGRKKYSVTYLSDKRAVTVRIYDDNENYIGKSFFQVSDSGLLTGASHYYYLGDLKQHSDLLSHITFSTDDIEFEDLLLFRIDNYAGGRLERWTEYEYTKKTIDDEETYILDYKQMSQVFVDDVSGEVTHTVPVSKVQYTFSVIGDLDKEFMSRYIRFWRKVEGFDPNTDLLKCETASFPSNKVKKTSSTVTFYDAVNDVWNTAGRTEYWYIDIDNILTNDLDSEYNIYNWFPDSVMQDYMNAVIANFDLPTFVEFLRNSAGTSDLVSKIKVDSEMSSYFTDAYENALFTSSNELDSIKNICLDPFEGVVKYEAKYDKQFRIIEEKWFDPFTNLTQIKKYEYVTRTDTDTSETYNIQVYTLADGDGQNQVVIERLERDNEVVYGGKIFTYREDGRIFQIDHYQKGVLVLVECYTYKSLSYEEKVKTFENSTLLNLLYDDETLTATEIYKEHVYFWNPVSEKLQQEIFYDKNGSQIDNKFYVYDDSGRLTRIDRFTSQGFREEIIEYSYSVNGQNLTEPLPINSTIFNNKGKAIKKTVYGYNSALVKTSLIVYEKLTPSDDWTLSEELYFDVEGKLLSQKDYKADVYTKYEYN